MAAGMDQESIVRRELTSRCIAIVSPPSSLTHRDVLVRAHHQMNRADPTLLEYMKYHIDNVDPSQGTTYEKAKKFGQILIDNCESPPNP